MIKVLKGFVAVIPQKKDMITKSGIILTKDTDETIFGKVISSGIDGVERDNIVLFIKSKGLPIDNEYAACILVKEGDVMAIVEE